MNKRDNLLSLTDSSGTPEHVPAAFFLHFDGRFHTGQAAIDKHLEFFRHTGMDFVKIQYEQNFPPPATPIREPEDWARAPLYPDEFFEAPVQVAEGLVKAAKREALVIMTLYSPFMRARHLAGEVDLVEQLKENPAAVQRGLEIMTENVLKLVRGCKRAGVDGFYASSQGGEADRFRGTDLFQKYIKPTDLAVWDEIQSCAFNILHICDYDGEYDDLSPFLDYPGQVVNCSLKLGGKTRRTLTPREAAEFFGRPFMGGLDRKGVLATGSAQEIRQAVEGVLAQAPERFILAADCTVPGDTAWDNLKTAIETAHAHTA
jgi:uroporphyrinogen decarboxylase